MTQLTQQEIEKLLLEFFDEIRPHINGHKTAMGKFFKALDLLKEERERAGKLAEALKRIRLYVEAGDTMSYSDIFIYSIIETAITEYKNEKP